MKQEDEVIHKSEDLNIKIEVSNDGGDIEEVKKTMEITEKIKRVIEESFGKEGDAAVQGAAIVEDTDHGSGSGQNIPVKMEIGGAESAPANDTDNVIKLDYSNMSNDDYDDIADSESDHGGDLELELEELVDDTTMAKSEEDQKETEEKLRLFAKEMKKVKTLPMPGSRKSDFKEDIGEAFAKLLPPQILCRLTPNRCGLCHEDFTSELFLQ